MTAPESRSSGSGKVRVFIVEDHRLVRTALAAVFDRRGDFDLVGQAATIAAAEQAIADTLPDVVLLDVRLPDGSGWDLCRRLRHDLPQVRCVILSGAPMEISPAEVAASGAAAYVRKEDPLEDLLATIQDVARRGDDS